jgi:hypothetical protein
MGCLSNRGAIGIEYSYKKISNSFKVMKAYFGVFLYFIIGISYSQNLILNGFFDNNGTNWNCGPEVRAVSTYGGIGTNRVAEVDFAAKLCQTITSFVPGNKYELSFISSRRTPPSSCSAPANADIVVNVGTDLNTTVTRTNTTFKFSKSTFIFTASSSTLTFSITPGNSFNASRTTCGVIIDSIYILPINVLPIELNLFTAYRKANIVKINWGVATQKNNKQFIVEKSIDAKNFKMLHNIDGAGNLNEYRSYSIVDTCYIFEPVYYRLKQVDYDGSYTYSEVISVVEEEINEFDISVYPNPVSDILYIQHSNEVNKMELYSMDGLYIQDLSLNTSQNVVDLSFLQSGFYFIKFISPEKIITKKIERL